MRAIAAQRGSETSFAQLAEALAMMRWEHAQGREADTSDHRFHVVLAEATGNGTLVSICDLLWRAQTKFRIWQEILQPHADGGLSSHVGQGSRGLIFEAVQARNPRKASHAMTRHLNNIRDALMVASNAKSMAAPKSSTNSAKKIR